MTASLKLKKRVLHHNNGDHLPVIVLERIQQYHTLQEHVRAVVITDVSEADLHQLIAAEHSHEEGKPDSLIILNKSGANIQKKNPVLPPVATESATKRYHDNFWKNVENKACPTPEHVIDGLLEIALEMMQARL